MLTIYLTFFLSGFPALLYQLVWQRSLFTFFGVNIESITVVVAAFMLGLGFGSLLGGRLSKYAAISPLVTFGLMEIGIAGFGWLSLSLFDYVGALSAGASSAAVFLITFTMVLIPTLFMGATLPLLTAFLVRFEHNVGRSVGILYFVNTLGSAAACFAAAVWMFAAFGKSGTIDIAVVINLLVGTGALSYWWWSSRHSKDRPALETEEGDQSSANILPFSLAMLLAGMVGLLSLSYEILWARIFMIASAGWALSFPILLGCFLTGVASGSYFARALSKNTSIRTHNDNLRILGWFLLCTNLIGFSAIPAFAFSLNAGIITTPVFLILVFLGAATMGAILPLVAHYSIAPNRNTGSKLSFIYMSNIIGSATGSLLTGFILLDLMPVKHVTLFLAIFGLLLSALLFIRSAEPRVFFNRGIITITLSIAGLVLLNPILFDDLYERIIYKRGYSGQKFDNVFEGRSGVITVAQDGTVWGGGTYDGALNTDLVKNTNGIERAYMLSAFHEAPKKVLMIGLSTGSWAKVIANHPSVEKLTVVEINPRYLELISGYEVVRSILDNPKVEVIIDDGRRWLNANLDRKFDAIINNTTLHWRSYASNLLSQEFLELMRQHTRPGGVIMYNGTCSPEAYKTAAEYFPYFYRYHSMAIVSDSPLKINTERLRNTLPKIRFGNEFALDPQKQESNFAINRLIASFNHSANDSTQAAKHSNNCYENGMKLETRDSTLANYNGLRLITDDNMGVEWLRQPWMELVANKRSYNERRAKRDSQAKR